MIWIDVVKKISVLDSLFNLTYNLNEFEQIHRNTVKKKEK